MKATGIIRKLDSLGRIVIPKEVRDKMGMQEGTPMEIYTDGGKVIITTYKPFCMFCDDSEDNFEYKGKIVCKKCASEMNLK